MHCFLSFNVKGVSEESQYNVLQLFTYIKRSGYLTNINICFKSSFSPYGISEEGKSISTSGKSEKPSQTKILMLETEEQVGFYYGPMSLLELDTDSKLWMHMWFLRIPHSSYYTMYILPAQ